jgi:homoserine kinase
MTARHRIVRVPASSANLGPGYDVMAAAVALYLELEVAEAGEFSFDPGPLDVPVGRDNLIVRAFERLHSADGISFSIESEIPLARGLGSSAAAIVAGLYAADHLFELGLSKKDFLAHATQLEGHPDNVAAAIYGGFVICNLEGKIGDAEAVRFDPPDGLEAIAVIPAEEVSTMDARGAIPETVLTGEAVANVSAVATLVLGLQTADLDLVADGLRDRIHQPRRRPLYPRSMELVDAAREIGALGATISGAGPTVLVWTTWQDAGKVAEALEERASGWAEVKRLPFTPLGADVPEL